MERLRAAPSIELVVAHYREDLKWLDNVPAGLSITVYHKGGLGVGDVPMENIGREAHSYLHHIVSRYDDLADVTVFCQGKPFDHVPDFHKILRGLAAGEIVVSGFRWLGFIIEQEDREGRVFKEWGRNTDGHTLPLALFWKELFGEEVPEAIPFYPGAHFIVTRDQVRGRPKAFYEKALALSTGIPDAGHCFERCWDRLVKAEGVPEEFRKAEYPVYLRPISRLGLSWDDVPRRGSINRSAGPS